ncbi:hypothetical protein EJ02DRAFT_179815 [Clathrospora elynae]|uniref:Uncharacterized protein n=1 Tax=Clathrospora elynae TaxID=706981 RepID=A0A6A5S419_9PLEO|nr:hypothetical protein EJ02DRAFT_179815 [Clathrospora elynae]
MQESGAAALNASHLSISFIDAYPFPSTVFNPADPPTPPPSPRGTPSRRHLLPPRLRKPPPPTYEPLLPVRHPSSRPYHVFYLHGFPYMPERECTAHKCAYCTKQRPRPATRKTRLNEKIYIVDCGLVMAQWPCEIPIDFR